VEWVAKRKTGKSATITFALTRPGFDAVCSYGGASREIMAESRLLPNVRNANSESMDMLSTQQRVMVGHASFFPKLSSGNPAGGSLLWAWPKHFEGPVPRVGMSKEWMGLSQKWACPKGMSQEWACPKNGPVPRMGLSPKPVPRVGLSQESTANNIIDGGTVITL
jgi:hypothetical protein